MQLWQYRTVCFGPDVRHITGDSDKYCTWDQHDEKMAELGIKAWEAYAISSSTSILVYYLKRPFARAAEGV